MTSTLTSSGRSQAASATNGLDVERPAPGTGDKEAADAGADGTGAHGTGAHGTATRNAVSGAVSAGGQPHGEAAVERPEPAHPLSAKAGDHHSIYRLLVSCMQQPSQAEFSAQLECPLYRPSDRLVIRQNEHVLAHALAMNRQMRFGSMLLPILVIKDFVVSPEFRGRGLGSKLLAAIDDVVEQRGAVFATICTESPQFFQHYNWHVCLRHSYSTANARRILSQLGEQFSGVRRPLERNPAEIGIRIWRHVEEEALVQLYSRNTESSLGPVLRSEAYWRWLLSRRGFDRVYVATQGREKGELGDISSIVGYAVMQQARIIELVSDSAHPAAGRELLARACRDAIEQDLHHVRLEASPDDPLHAILESSGGSRQYHESENGSVHMVRFPKPLQFLRTIGPSLLARCRHAAVSLPCELGINLDGQKYSVRVHGRRQTVKPGKLGRSYLECDAGGLVRLLLGHLDVPAAIAAGRIGASTKVAADTAKILFPQLPIWRPAWDDSPA